MTTRRRQHRIDLSFGPGHGPVSGVLNAAAAMYALTMWLEVGNGSAWWGLTAGIAMASIGVIVARAYEQPASVQLFRAGCWSAAGFWSGWTLSGFAGVPVGRPFGSDFRLLTAFTSPGTPWSWRPLYGMVIGAAVVAMIGWRIEVAIKKAEKEAAEKAERLAREAELAAETRRLNMTPVNEEEGIGWEWQKLLERITRLTGPGWKNAITGEPVTKPAKDDVARGVVVRDTEGGIRIIGVEKWDPDYGFTLDVTLPDDGTVLKDVKKYEEALAAAADLPEGCGVEMYPNPGMGRRNILIDVTTATALAEDIPAPPVEMDTIENKQGIGVRTNGTDAEIDQRYNCVTLIGQVDSGKSNQLNAIIKANAQCTDVLLCGIDLSGQGRVLRPWIRAYAERRAKKPVFAQVAHTPHRARLLAASIVNIVNGRTADYAEMMFKEGTDKIMVRPTLPEIILVVDEFGELPEDVKDMIGTIVDTGRGAGVRVVACALEATAQYIPTSIIRQSRVRMAMRVTDEAQLQYLFDATWSTRLDPQSMTWKGSGFAAEGGETPWKFKGYRIDPRRIDEISVQVAGWRPDLDELSLQRADTVTLKVRTDMGREEVTFTGVWTNAEAETYPEIFPASSGVRVAAAGSAQAGGTATATKEGTTVTDSSPGTAADAARGMNAAVDDMNDALANLEKAAAAAEAKHNAGKTDDDQGDAGDGDPASSGPAVPSADELAAWFKMTPDEPTPGRPSTSPADPPPAADNGGHPGGPPTNTNPQGKQHPKRRTLQIVAEQADKGGIGPSKITEILAAEGYGTDRATVQGWLQKFKANGKVTQDQPRDPWFPGPDIGDPYAGPGQ